MQAVIGCYRIVSALEYLSPSSVPCKSIFWSSLHHNDRKIMFGAFRTSSPLSGGLLWYISILARSYLPCLSSPTNSPPSQENTLASLHPPKAPSAQTPPSRRQCYSDRRQFPQEAQHGVYNQAGEVERGDANGGGDETEGQIYHV